MRFLFCLWQLWRYRDERLDLVVDRSPTGLHSGSEGTRLDAVDELKHFAKVKVVGSNLVLRSRNDVL